MPLLAASIVRGVNGRIVLLLLVVEVLRGAFEYFLVMLSIDCSKPDLRHTKMRTCTLEAGQNDHNSGIIWESGDRGKSAKLTHSAKALAKKLIKNKR